MALTVEPGEIVAVTGPSGSGKSTLLACLAGLDEPDGGVVRIDGERISRRPEEERARLRARRIGVLYQSANLVGHLRVDANVALAQRLAGARRTPSCAPSCSSAWASRAARTPGPAQLSGGELARAGLAVALANDPPCCSPTSRPASSTRRRPSDILELLRERARRRGRRPRRDPQHRGGRRRGARAAPARRKRRGVTNVLVVLRRRRRARSAPARPPPSRFSRDVRGPLRRAHRARRALGLGQVHADPSHGRARRADGRLGRPGPASAHARELRPGPVAVVFQGPSLLAPLSVAENVALPLLLAGEREPDARRARAEALALLDLADLTDKLPEEISGGQAQRAAIARALAGDPVLLLADEPTGQLDHATGAHVVDALLDAAGHSGAALVVATHDMAVADRFDERWEMHSGLLQAPVLERAWSRRLAVAGCSPTAALACSRRRSAWPSASPCSRRSGRSSLDEREDDDRARSRACRSTGRSRALRAPARRRCCKGAEPAGRPRRPGRRLRTDERPVRDDRGLQPADGPGL